MDLKTILNGAAAVAGTLNPAVALAIKAVNSFLPDDKKLPETATGADVSAAVDTLTPDDRAEVLKMEIQLEIAREEGGTERYVAMVGADGQSTRPRIALMMAWCVVMAIAGAMLILAYGVYRDGLVGLDNATIALAGCFAVVTAIPARVLTRYYGELRREQENRLGIEAPTNPITQFIRRKS
jgi:hypothetical protein